MSNVHFSKTRVSRNTISTMLKAMYTFSKPGLLCFTIRTMLWAMCLFQNLGFLTIPSVQCCKQCAISKTRVSLPSVQCCIVSNACALSKTLVSSQFHQYNVESSVHFSKPGFLYHQHNMLKAMWTFQNPGPRNTINTMLKSMYTKPGVLYHPYNVVSNLCFTAFWHHNTVCINCTMFWAMYIHFPKLGFLYHPYNVESNAYIHFPKPVFPHTYDTISAMRKTMCTFQNPGVFNISTMLLKQCALFKTWDSSQSVQCWKQCAISKTWVSSSQYHQYNDVSNVHFPKPGFPHNTISTML